MPYRSNKPPRCQHKPSASCALCRREKNDLEQVGAWAREPSTAMAGARSDYESFIQDTALRTTTTKVSVSSPTTHSKKPNNHQQHPPQQQRIKSHQPALPTYTTIPKTPSSSVAATRSNSPVAHRPISVSIATSTPRTVPVYHNSTSRQPVVPVPAKPTATIGAVGGNLQASSVPRTSTAAAAAAAARPGAHFVLARGSVCVGGEENESEEESEEESESESESEEDSDDSDDEDDEDE